jgi:hypothetical protein
MFRGRRGRGGLSITIRTFRSLTRSFVTSSYYYICVVSRNVHTWCTDFHLSQSIILYITSNTRASVLSSAKHMRLCSHPSTKEDAELPAAILYIQWHSCPRKKLNPTVLFD